MKKWWFFLVMGIVAVMLAACGSTATTKSSNKQENYPTKPIMFVAPSGAGGGWDLTARAITKILDETNLVKQTMTVENKPGGGGTVFMAEYATQDKNNDYKLFVNSPPIIINNLKAEGNSPYGYKDTTPLAQLTKDFGAIVVRADSKFQSMSQLLDAIKQNPKSVTVAGGSAPGSMDHLVAILPIYKSGIDPKIVKYVSYDGGGEAIAALLGGNTDVIATDASSVGEYVKAGKVRVLAVSAPERLGGVLKDAPTLKELGIDAEFTIWRGVFGPKQMSDDAKKFWENTFKKLSEHEKWKEELTKQGWEPEYKGSKEFTQFLQEQEQLISDMLKSLGMHK
ncbi:tripartite tricarboxylate transporter substrate binding protein [Aeribacillus pallidus]|uniref:Bug family tripartite tricarboxylate transporter substrate binding protein n=2 Tax=Bacillaceae TaxID=186817 RepID=UPI0007B4710F|nr:MULTISPECIES: tripartite tricarboxylate transporter substrate binding protein [Aeribacillus]KZM57039.1 transporter [Aeribacillus pallidus]MED0652106.1 tripartite tricarboxylate transporter substrate binding protein [Aeribacillus composti]MED0703107.1 tripartite tricarboxylate transporter substrate binding protein [Aeribacillus composti]MED4488548.1 tripartite tricarboxylate transporter substrate binding protein [Aeribacillus pallidus]